ncbi:MAG TPA: aminotransferase class III-fold pyridoxal phosphate-dependent enzyme, partial [Kofleriaceae bacterium]|nr:aminotransferase class III-fold pyridoxal phosphate-dependent enzyme [Kofleriaceae bacterium]
LAKGLGGGVPIGAIAVNDKAAESLAFKAGGAVLHANTFGGNPLACAAANAVFDIIDDEKLLDQVTSQGAYLGQQLDALAKEFPGHVTEARGRGLLRGLAVSGLPGDVTAKCRDRGLLLSVAGDKVVRFAPPYIVSRALIDEAVAILRGVLAEGVGKA